MPEPLTDAARLAARASREAPESAYAWGRLVAALALSAIGGVGMWSVISAIHEVGSSR